MYDVNENMDVCNYCGALYVPRHHRYKNRCVDCGKLYGRFRAAERRGVASEILLCGEQLMKRSKRASDWTQENYYSHVSEVLEQYKCTSAHNIHKRIKDESTSQKEDERMTTKQPVDTATQEQGKVCKQCGRYLPICSFRKYKSRGTGKYNTKQGHYTICRQCESISQRAALAIKNGDEPTVNKLRAHYLLLKERGFGPVTAPAKRLLGVDDIVTRRRRNNLDELLASVQDTEVLVGTVNTELESELMQHCRLVRERGYKSFEDADAAHRRLADELRAHSDELYEEINDLMDDWYMEG